MTRHLNVLLLLVLGLVALPGCRSNAANVMKINAEGGNVDIQVLNPGLQEELELASGRCAYEADILTCWVRIRNHEDDKLQYEYRWRWYDADGKQITVGGGGDNWATRWANPLEEVEVDGHATREGAVRAEFHLRYASE
ncbi:MAG: DUF1425 domain-containing protein [Planctomycetes bacterium]|nr:DUF1425 domain-containing protein [Planctomycetota bacterium]